ARQPVAMLQDLCQADLFASTDGLGRIALRTCSSFQTVFFLVLFTQFIARNPGFCFRQLPFAGEKLHVFGYSYALQQIYFVYCAWMSLPFCRNFHLSCPWTDSLCCDRPIRSFLNPTG